jgi:hypothetical protein
MEIIQVINGAHEDSLAAIAFNRVKREVYTAAEGDRAIKVRPAVLLLHNSKPQPCHTVHHVWV